MPPRPPGRRRLLLLGAGCAALASAAGPARAEDRAQTLFDTGVEQMDAAHYDAGCPMIEQSYRLDPRPGTLFALAECRLAQGLVASAAARYEEYLGVYAALPPAKKAKQGDRNQVARGQVAALAAKVPRLTLIGPSPAPPGLVVKRDGVVVPLALLGEAVAIDPGEHVLSVGRAGAAPVEVHLVLSRGEKRVIELHAATLPPSAAEPPADGPRFAAAETSAATRPSTRRTATYVAGGVGVLGLALGAVTGGLMLSKQGAVKSGCQDTGGGVELCTPDGAAAGNAAKTLGLVSSIAFATGLAGVGVGAVLLLTSPGDAARGNAPGGPAPAQPASPVTAALAIRPGGAGFELAGSW